MRYEKGLFALFVAFAMFLIVVRFPMTGFVLLSPAQETNAVWWNASFHYRVSVNANTDGYNRTNWPIEYNMNFTQLLANLSVSAAFDNNSVRVVEYNSQGNVVSEVPSQIKQNVSYSQNNAVVTVIWIMNGTTLENTDREWMIYFDTVQNPKTAPAYQTLLRYYWDGENLSVNNSKLLTKINTNKANYTSGFDYAEFRGGAVLFSAALGTETIEHSSLYNYTVGTTGFDLRNNFNIIEQGPVRFTAEQVGNEVLWGTTSQTNVMQIRKKYTFYENTSWVRIEQVFKNVDTGSVLRSSKFFQLFFYYFKYSLHIDAQRAFGMDFSTETGDPYSYSSAYSSSSKGIGVINEYESVSNFKARREVGKDIGIELTNATIASGVNLTQRAVVVFNDQASHDPVSDLKTRLQNAVSISQTQPNSYSIAINSSSNFTIYNRNETAYLYGTVTTDFHNLTNNVTGILMKPDANMSIQLYDNGQNGDAAAGDRIWTGRYDILTTDLTGVWYFNVTAFNNGTRINASGLTAFNVTNVYFVNTTILNPNGLAGRIVNASINVSNYRRDIRIPAATIGCQFTPGNVDVSSNVTELGNGDYFVNLQSPFGNGLYQLTCNATKFSNAGNDSEYFTVEVSSTQLITEMSPYVYAYTNSTYDANFSYTLTALIKNVGEGSGFGINISVALPENLTANRTSYSAGNVLFNMNKTIEFNITLAKGAGAGLYQINVTLNWTNFDTSNSSKTNISFVNILENGYLIIDNGVATQTMPHNTSMIAGSFNVSSVGNINIGNVSVICQSGAVCQNFTVVFSPSSNVSMLKNTSMEVFVNVSVPWSHRNGTFTGDANISSGNTSKLFLLNITIPFNNSWDITPTSCIRVVTINLSDVLCTIDVINIGNQPLMFNITPTGYINYTASDYANATAYPNQTFRWTIRYDTSNAPIGTFNRTYLIAQNETDNKTVFVSIRTATGPAVNVTINPTKIEQTASLEINATVQDMTSSGIKWVFVNVTAPSGQIYTKNMTLLQNISNLYYYTSAFPGNWSNTTERGNYIVRVYAIDNIDVQGSGTKNFTVYAKLNVLSNAYLSSYFQGDVVNIYYRMYDNLSQPMDAGNATFRVMNPNGDTVYFIIYPVYGGGTVFPTPQFSLGTDAVLGTYYVITNSTFPDSIGNGTAIHAKNTSFNVYTKTSAAGLSASIDTSDRWYPLDNVRIQVAAYDASGTYITDALVNVSVYNQTGAVIYNRSNIPRSAIGAYYANFTAPLQTGVYSVRSDVFYAGKATVNFKSFEIAPRSVNATGIQVNIVSKESWALGTDYTAYIQTMNLNGDMTDAQVNASVYDPSGNLLANLQAKNMSDTGIYYVNWTISNSASLGMYTLKVTATKNATEIRYSSFDVVSGTISQEEKLDIHISTTTFWYATNTAKVYITLYNKKGAVVSADSITAAILDPSGNTLQTSFNVYQEASGVYYFNWPIPTTPATGMYTVRVNATALNITTQKVQAFRVTQGGPYMFSINAPAYGYIGQNMNFTVNATNEGDGPAETQFTCWINASTQRSIISWNKQISAQQLYTIDKEIYVPADIFPGQYQLVCQLHVVNDPYKDSTAVDSFQVLTALATTTSVVQYAPPKKINITDYPKSIEMAKGADSTFIITIRNDGTSDITDLVLTIEGIPSSWYEVFVNKKVLEVNNTQNYMLYLKIPENTTMNQTVFRINASSGNSSDSRLIMLLIFGSQEDLYRYQLDQSESRTQTLEKKIMENREKLDNMDGLLDLLRQAKVKNIEGYEALTKKDLPTVKEKISQTKDILDQIDNVFEKDKGKENGNIIFIPSSIPEWFLLIFVLAIFSVFVVMIGIMISNRNLERLVILTKYPSRKEVKDVISSQKKNAFNSLMKRKKEVLDFLSNLDIQLKNNMIAQDSYSRMRIENETMLNDINAKIDTLKADLETDFEKTEDLKREKEKIENLLLVLSEQFKNRMISEQHYAEIKDKNQELLKNIEKQMRDIKK